jgi:hypothetical protein
MITRKEITAHLDMGNDGDIAIARQRYYELMHLLTATCALLEHEGSRGVVAHARTVAASSNAPSVRCVKALGVHRVALRTDKVSMRTDKVSMRQDARSLGTRQLLRAAAATRVDGEPSGSHAAGGASEPDPSAAAAGSLPDTAGGSALEEPSAEAAAAPPTDSLEGSKRGKRRAAQGGSRFESAGRERGVLRVLTKARSMQRTRKPTPHGHRRLCR